MPLRFSKIIILLMGVYSLFFSVPALAESYPFWYEEVIIENPTCPFYYYEIGGEQVRAPCPYGTMKPGDKEGYIQIERAAAGLCRYNVCSKEGVCREGKKFMGEDRVGADYAGAGADADKRCIQAYTEDSKDNTYCNLITERNPKEFCFSFARPNFNIYWVIYYFKIFAPLILGTLLVFWYRKNKQKSGLWLTNSIALSLAGVFSNDSWKMDLSPRFVYYMLIPPVLSIIAFFWSKKWFTTAIVIGNIIAIILLVFMIIIPET